MAVTVAELRAKVSLDDSEFQSGLSRVKSGLGEIGKGATDTADKVDTASKSVDKLNQRAKALSAIGEQVGDRIMVGLTLPMIAAAGASIKYASDTSESLSKVKVVFGSSADSIEKFAATAATALGQSRQEALESAGTFGNLFVSMGITADKSADMSKKILQLGADLGSFNNVPTAEALDAIKSGLVGETEPLRRFGVNLNEATIRAKALQLGLAEGKEELSANVKAQSAYALILEQTGTAQGDFARTSDGLANSSKTLSSELKDLAAEAGKTLLPFAISAVKHIRELLTTLNNLPEPVKQTALAFTVFVAGAGPVLSVVGRMIKAYTELRGAIIALKAVETVTGGGAGVASGVAGAAGKAGLGGRLLGGAGAVLGSAAGLAATVGVGAVGAAWGANEFADSRRGLKSPGVMGTLNELNPFRDRKAEEAKADAERAATLAKFREDIKAGNSPREQARAAARASAEKAQQQAKADGEKAAKDQIEKIKERIKAEDNAYSVIMAKASAEVDMYKGDDKAYAEANIIEPIIKARQLEIKALLSQMEGKTDLKEQYTKLEEEYWKLEGQGNSLIAAANERQDKANKEGIKQQREINKLFEEGFLKSVEARLQIGSEETKAQREFAAFGPIIRADQDKIRNMANALLRKGLTDGDKAKEYAELVKSYWEGESAYNERMANAQREVRDSQEKALKEQEKNQKEAEEKAKDQARGKYDLAGAQVGLIEAKLRNDPRLSDDMRKRLLIPALQAQMQALMKAAPNETELDRIRRETEVESVRNRIGEGLGILGNERQGRGRNAREEKGMFGRGIGGDIIPLGAGINGDIGGAKVANRAAEMTGGIKVYQIIVQGNTPQQIRQNLLQQLNSLEAEMGNM